MSACTTSDLRLSSLAIGARVWIVPGRHSSAFDSPRAGTLIEGEAPAVSPRSGGLVRHDDGRVYGWSRYEMVPLGTVTFVERAWAAIGDRGARLFAFVAGALASRRHGREAARGVRK